MNHGTMQAFALAAKHLSRTDSSFSAVLDFYSVRHPSQYDLPVAPELLVLPGLQV